MADLALQIGQIDLVSIRNQQLAHSTCCQIQGGGTTQPARAHDQHSSVVDSLLAFYADLRQKHMAAVAQQLIVVHGDGAVRRWKVARVPVLQADQFIASGADGLPRSFVGPPFFRGFIFVPVKVLLIYLHEHLLRFGVGLVGCEVFALHIFNKVGQCALEL